MSQITLLLTGAEIYEMTVGDVTVKIERPCFSYREKQGLRC
jgi:hypothetical protein